jgi:hypothetical protein
MLRDSEPLTGHHEYNKGIYKKISVTEHIHE